MSPDRDVPDAVERYLVGLMINAGRIGGSVGGTKRSTDAGGRGAASAVGRMATVTVERTVKIGWSTDLGGLRGRVSDRTIDLEAVKGGVRFVVPLGRTGLQQVVVDVAVESVDGPGSTVNVRTYAKEGLLSRHPARRVADQVIAAIETGSE